jgi:hypothetical protein
MVAPPAGSDKWATARCYVPLVPNHRRRSRFLVWGVLLVVVLVAATVARSFVFPGSDSVRKADVVIVLAGAGDERLVRAVALMNDDVAPTLVITNGNDPSWPAGNRVCDSPHKFQVLCARAPRNTRAEARAIARTVRSQGWQHVIVTTSSYHVTRARLLLRRCVNGQVSVVSARPLGGGIGSPARIGHELLATLRALTFQRGC